MYDRYSYGIEYASIKQTSAQISQAISHAGNGVLKQMKCDMASNVGMWLTTAYFMFLRCPEEELLPTVIWKIMFPREIFTSLINLEPAHIGHFTFL